jgi:hypothetical protein
MVPLSAIAGKNEDKLHRSRDAAFCIRGLRHGTGKNDAERLIASRRSSTPGGRTGFGSITLGALLRRKTKNKTRQAERRQTPK